jgi:alcohol dehydrogenase
MKMRAAVMYAQGQARPYAKSKPFVIEEVELDGPKENEVLVEIRAAGLCHSDLSTIEGLRARPLPTVGGHESAGIVRELGRNVDDLKPGTPCVIAFVSSCGECLSCKVGRPNLCDTHGAAKAVGELPMGGRRLRINGEEVHHYSCVSCFAEYAVVPRSAVIPIDEDISIEDAALFGCGVITGAGAVINTAKVPPGATVAVVGLGGVGLNAMLAANVSGAARVIAVDISDEKLALARQLGATDTFNAGDTDCVAQIVEATRGGVEYGFEMAGSVKALETAYAITRKGGVTTTAGLPSSESGLTIDVAALVQGEKTLKGSYMGSCVAARDIPRLLTLYKQGRLPVDRLRSATLRMDQINEGFDRLADGSVVRQILATHT